MLYNIKYKTSKRYGNVAPNRRNWIRDIVFNVVELGYQDSISIPVKEFTKAKAKALIKEKVKAHLAEQSEVEEYTEEISITKI